jgi:thioredoxin reductase (NADPH)
VLESNAPGGQAGASSKIENYLGFPTGISGHELAGRAYAQAQKFGAEMLIAKDAKGLACDRRPYAVLIGDGQSVPARTVVIASGAQYRRLQLENLSKFEGAGVYYGATHLEAQLCGGEEVMSWAAATLPVRRQSFWRKQPDECMCLFDLTAWLRQCRVT